MNTSPRFRLVVSSASAAVLLTAAAAALPRAARAQGSPAAPSAVPAAVGAPGAKSAAARSKTRTLRGTVVAVDAATGTVRLAPEKGGEAVAVLVKKTSRFGRMGKETAGLQDFTAGDPIVARLSFRAEGGEVWLRELRDRASHEAYTRDRREICVGTVTQNGGDRLEVRRADGGLLAFRVTGKSVSRKNGAAVPASAFAVGAPVAVQPRSLPSGDLMARVISDSAADIATVGMESRASWKGKIESVDAARNALVLRRDDGQAREVAVAADAKIARGKAPLAMKDLAPGLNVRIHLRSVPAPAAAAGGSARTADKIAVLGAKATVAAATR
jgi:hypothetical protein